MQRRLIAAVLCTWLAGLAQAGLFTSTDVPKGIYDYQTTTSTVAVPGMQISDVNVIIHDLRHTWVADLRIWITSPQGTSVVLFNRRGGSGDNLIGTVFDDSASIPISLGSAPFTGSFRPEQPLTAFKRENAGGTWVLYIADLLWLDQGVLNSWSLEVTPVPEPSTLVLAAAGLAVTALLRSRRA